MNPVSKFKAWWQQLELRDQKALGALAGVMVPILVWALIVQPLQSSKADLRDQINQKEQLITWLQKNGAAAKAVAGSQTASDTATTSSEQDLTSMVIRYAGAQGLKLQKFEMDARNGLRIWLESVPYNALLKMLSELEREQGVQINDATIDRTDQSGTVDLRGVLISR